MEDDLKIGYDGTSIAGAFITVGLGLIMAMYFFYRIIVVVSTNEHSYDSRPYFWTEQ